MWTVIATWRMAQEGIEKASAMLDQNIDGGEALEAAVKEVEDNPYYKSVGYGGLPNEQGVVELDAGFMNGSTLGVGAVCGVHRIANPIAVARSLSEYETNSILVSEGAEAYAKEHGFQQKDLLTERAEILYENRMKETGKTVLKPYNGHDTVGVCVLDIKGHIDAGTSTSGLFMKKPGRIGDSPIVGSGFYADSAAGAATATGLGEDLMRGCLSYEIVRQMRQGMAVQEACDSALNDLETELIQQRGHCGDLSVVALAKDGSFGAATNIKDFSFTVSQSGKQPIVYVANRADKHTFYEPASQQWMDDYMHERMKPVSRL